MAYFESFVQNDEFSKKRVFHKAFVEAVENLGKLRKKTARSASRQGKNGMSFPQLPQLPCGKLSFSFFAFSTLRPLDKKRGGKKSIRKWKKGEFAKTEKTSAKREEEEGKGKGRETARQF